MGKIATLRPALAAFVLSLAACSHAPPADFAPDPGLVAHIKSLVIATNQASACPGQAIAMTYYAQLDDGTLVRFERTYDDKHPPRLHINFLRLTSPDAYPQQDGNWVASADPLQSALHGFRLSAFLRANPAINTFKAIAPEYSCTPHVFGFAGPSGDVEQGGGNGPDVTVRLAVLRSPYVDRLIVAAIHVEDHLPQYVFADASEVPPSDWIRVIAAGGRGGPGVAGRRGIKGRDGQPGCPGSAGGAGGAGGNGGPGAPGGRGGRITVVVPDSEPFLAGLVVAETPGGSGGPGGRPGHGGDGGKGGAARPQNERCVKGTDGADGPSGRPGRDGPDGMPGYQPQIVTAPADQVFGAVVPPALADLLAWKPEGQQNR